MGADARTTRRGMVIGLDGATWKLLDRFIERGVMPTLGKLRDEGVHGPLYSVVPPMTATAWTTYQTGKGPGKHGIFDWTEPVPGSYLYRPIDSSRVQSRTLFQILGDRGARVATVNLPLTFPARPINGIAVGDMLTPSKETPGFVHPPAFKAQLDRLVPDYVIDTTLCDREDDIEPFLGRLRAMIDGKGKLIQHLLERQPGHDEWDFFCAVWVEMDRMQHCLWHIFDETHPRHDTTLARKYGERILDIYRMLDTRVAEMMAARPADCNVMFISDHGFGPCRYKVFLNTWLAQEGFLTFRQGGRAQRGWASGNHEPDGLFLGWGPDFRKGARVEGANIADILPTLFATMGVPIPDDVDGRVLQEAFARPIRATWTEARAYAGSTAPTRDTATDKAIEERLRGLGYLQ